MEDKEFRRVVLSAVLGTLAGFITSQLCEKFLFKEVCVGENQSDAKFVQTPNPATSK